MQPSQYKRYRYHVDEVPVTLPIPFDGELGIIHDSKNFFVELVNRDDLIVGLFFLYDWWEINGMEINDWQEFACFYDEVNAGEQELDFWQLSYLIDVDDDGNKSYDFEHTIPNLDSFILDLSKVLISGSRLKYPFGLTEEYAQVYREVLELKCGCKNCWDSIIRDIDKIC